MSPHRTTIRLALSTLFGIAAFVLPACHGSSSSGTTSSGPVAKFTPDTAAPGPGTIALLPGAVSGASFDVHVGVTGVPSFFGAAFRVKYDVTALLFNGMSSTGSFLRAGVTETNLLFFEDHASLPGEIIITATRIDPTFAPPVDVTTTSDLIVLNFTARKVILPATPEGRIDFDDPKQACDGTVAAPACGSIAVTWLGGAATAQ